LTEHVRQKNAVQEIDDTKLISSAIDKCNLRPEYKRLLKILYVERGFADVGYRMATDTCAINTNAANNTRDIIDAMNSGFRGISDRMTAQEIATKDAQIAAQAQKIFGLELAASQQAQNQYLVSQLGCKAPVPAFNVPAPWQYGNYGCSDCGNY